MKSVDAVQETLKKINDIDQSGYQLKSVLAVSDDALEQSHRFDQENSNLPLQGLPILLKDNIEAIGLPATAGSLALAETTVKKDSTWSPNGHCYLEDLFVDPNARGSGVGRSLTDYVKAFAMEKKCSRLYWNTDEDNATARKLYDTYVPESGKRQYRVPLT